MSLPRPVHFLTFALIAAVAWLVTGHAPTTAQAPPAGPDTEKRLQAVEQKLDRLLNKLDPQPVATADPKALAKLVEQIQQARETLANKLEQDVQRYTEFRKTNPFLWFSGKSGNMYVNRMARTEAERAEALRRRREASAQLATVENVLARGKTEDAVAALLLFKRRGVDFSKLPGAPENDAAALLRIYGLSLRLELEELDRVRKEAEEAFVNDQNAARELSNYEAEEEQHKTRIAATRQLFENLNKRLQELNMMKMLQP